MSVLNRRSFLKMAAAATASGFLLRCAKPAKPLKNVVMIIGDDHSARVLGCYGNDIIQTPNLDRMAGRGVKFTSAYANAPLCSASRQSLLTGKYPHATGVTLLRTSFSDENYTVAEHLQASGFVTGYIGKMHFNNNLDHGFQEQFTRRDLNDWRTTHHAEPLDASIPQRPKWKPFRDPARIWLNADTLPGNYPDESSQGTVYAKKAKEFIENHKDERFCLWVGFHEPHSPFNFPIEFQGKYDPQNMPWPETSPEDDRWIPQEFKDLTEDERRGIIASYYTSVEYLDKNVGMILDELDKQGLTDETLIIYIGDHGYLLNDHKRFEKHMMWEPAVGAPLIVNAGEHVEKGKSVDALTEFVDLAPTICNALQVEEMPEVQGKSLLPILKGKKQQHKDYVFSEFLADNKAMVKTREWKYIFTTGKRDLQQGYATGNPPSGILHRLYDQQNDYWEKTNVADDPANADVLVELQMLMIDHFMKTDPRAAQLPQGLTTDETLAWFCEPPDNNANVDAK